MQMAVIELEKNISYIEPTQNPLSANVVLIEGENNLWLYDVGNNPCVPQIISAFNTSNKKINVILSHFHADHIGNLDKISYSNVYQGRLTYKYTKTGEILENDLYFCDGNMNLHIFPLPSSHAKGSLALEINEKYCFLGDGVYAMQKGEKRLYNAGILKHNPVGGCDSTPMTRAGIKSVTFAAQNPMLTYYYHTWRDMPERFEMETVGDGFDVILSVIDKIAKFQEKNGYNGPQKK